MSALPARIESLAPSGSDGEMVMVAQLTAALAGVEKMPPEDVAEMRTRASMVEAAAAQGKATEVQLAAARLRLYAERRLGELWATGADLRGRETFSEAQWRDFERLYAIPRLWKPRGASVTVDLFEEAVETAMWERRSQTAYAVWMASLHNSARRDSRYLWLWRTWDDTWIVQYEDPRTGRRRRVHVAGTDQDALRKRAVLLGRLKEDPKAQAELLESRMGLDRVGRTASEQLGSVLDHVRIARESLASLSPDLSAEQKKELDGSYSRLDDIAAAIVVAVNL